MEDCKKDLKVKAKIPMTEFLRTVRTTLVELDKESQDEGLRYQLMHMRDILERWKIVGRKFFDFVYVMIPRCSTLMPVACSIFSKPKVADQTKKV